MLRLCFKFCSIIFRFCCRLQYFARHVQGYVKELRDVMQKKKGEDLKSDEVVMICRIAFVIPLAIADLTVVFLQNKLKVIALKTTTNINTLIRDLFHNPPSYKSSLTLSWKTPTIGNVSLPQFLSLSWQVADGNECLYTFDPTFFRNKRHCQHQKLIRYLPKGPTELPSLSTMMRVRRLRNLSEGSREKSMHHLVENTATRFQNFTVRIHWLRFYENCRAPEGRSGVAGKNFETKSRRCNLSNSKYP